MDVQKVKLIHQTKEAYGESWKSVLFEQYKMYVESADRISERRTACNNYLLTVNTALATIYGLTSNEIDTAVWQVIIPIAGILTCLVWWNLITTYRNLNSVKFKVIHELEGHLPAALYSYEWTLVDHRKGKPYKPLSHIEGRVPWIFILIYIAMVFCLFWQFVDTSSSVSTLFTNHSVLVGKP